MAFVLSAGQEWYSLVQQVVSLQDYRDGQEMGDIYGTQLSEPIFLNELHDRLKQLNPRRVQHAGMYRILGRLVEHDLGRQIAKVESCFHRLDPKFDMVQAPPPIPLLPADHRGTDIVKTNSSSSAPAPSQSGAVIDLTETENAQEDPDLWETDDEVDSDADEIIYGDDRDHLYVYEEPNRFIDLTEASDGDEPHDEDARRPQTRARDSAPIDLEDEEMPVADQVEQTTVAPTRPRQPPRVILWVDTRLLHAFDYRQWQLYEFFGEVMHENGHWMLQAQIFRNMEGLDIFAYRQAILMTRALMQGTFQTSDGSTAT